MFRGHVAELLRQSQGADVVDDLYNVASTAQRNAMCAEFYGKEYVLFDGVAGDASKLGSLKQLLEGATAAKKRAIILHISKALIPVMEKAILHPAMTHRWGLRTQALVRQGWRTRWGGMRWCRWAVA